MALEDISKENEKDPGEVDDKNSVALEEIEANKVGVFQTMFKNLAKAEHARMDFMKTEVSFHCRETRRFQTVCSLGDGTSWHIFKG